MKKKINQIINFFNTEFTEAKCELNYNTPYQLLVAVILSAQCTDKRVNEVTKTLFELAPTPELMLQLGKERLKQVIHSCGFYNHKAQSIIDATTSIINDFNGKIPMTMKELTSLRGVGRKTANVVLSEAFNTPAIAVDTHVHRISKRLGLTSASSSPEQCEQDLIKLVPKDKQSKFHIQAVWFGRYFCKSQKPMCDKCKLKDICKRN